jgi:hypothetical protein
VASTYSTVDDLLIGDMPIPPYINKQGYVDNAADEIDSRLGYVYATPFDVSDLSTMIRPARLTIKRIAAHLSSGRIILAMAVASEDRQVHAYGKSLIDEALAVLEKIANGEIPLVGAEPLDPDAISAPTSGPMIANIDQFSSVEAFYQQFSQPPTVSDLLRVSGG